MFQDILISPVIFIESIISSFILPKATSINPDYANAASGAMLSGLAVTGIIPEIDSFIGLVMTLVSMFVLFCIQTVIETHNSKKTISIWSNCIGLSSYGLISGLALSLTSGVDFVQYASSIMFSTLAISYSLGYRYIEYISDLKDKLPILMFSLSTPVGLLIGRYSGLDSVNTDLILGISAGTFVMFGINSVLMAGRNTDNVYLETEPKPNNKAFVCLSVLIGLAVSGVLQSSILDSSETTELVFNVTNTSSETTELVFNVTNTTELSTNITI